MISDYICDYAYLDAVAKPKPGHILPVPISLFFIDQNKKLKPVAIQLFQKTSSSNPIFTPRDPPNTWTLAKMWMNLADAIYHQSISHLASTHIIMEAISMSTNRQLAKNHPIFKIIIPHMFGTIAVNDIAGAILLGNSTRNVPESLMNVGGEGFETLVNLGVENWRMDLQGDFVEFLRHRGVDDQNVLKDYSYRNDGLLVHQAISEYVTEYVNTYYNTSDALHTDDELQNWAKELVRPVNNTNPGCGLKGVPGNGYFTTNDQLIRTLTSIIWVSSAQHAAINFKTYDQGAFPPNWPTILHGQPPSLKHKHEEVTEKEILESLPNREEHMETSLILANLDYLNTNRLGDFEVNYIADPPAVKILEKFRQRLRSVSDVIKQRNANREVPYTALDPDNIPNSIAV